jgi:signal transduction histidine kinase
MPTADGTDTGDTRARRRPRWRADLALVLAGTLACYLLSAALELNEWLSRALLRYERWQADELPLSLTVLAAGMAWFAMRRRHEAKAELQLRERAESNVGELLRQNRELSQRLLTLQENERLALARDLHDEVGQACSAIRVELAFIRHCEGARSQDIGPAAERAEGQALRLYTLVHDLLRRLRPVNLETLGLVAALQELSESWEERTGIGCFFHHEGVLRPLGDAIDIAVYRIAQEALTNVTRHAQASAVRVRLARVDESLTLVVQDDGRGIDAARTREGLGLLGARERAAALGGTLDLQSRPGAGVRIALHLPLAEASV